MGITGLIPFLEKSSRKGKISQFSGQTVAVDSYCWLHKGAFSCADKLLMGQPTDAYVRYCMRLVNMLLENGVKPILVFDGRHLPAKAGTEAKRRESRDANRRRAAELMRMGQTSEGRNLLRRSLDVTHEMALNLIKACQERNVDCIVAPYEADAQLAYLNISGIADVVITEDSDLLLFGCKKVFFKMDINGNGLLIEQDRLHLSMSLHKDHFTMDKFIYMCILSGCDYLPSLPGIGLAKACKFILKNMDSNIYTALARLPSYLNMRTLDVSKEYRDSFMRAVVTFKHQLVFCPLRRKQVRLNAPSPDVTAEQLHHAGDKVSADLAWQLALGNYDPFTMKKLHDFDPDNMHTVQSRRTNSWKEKPVAKQNSIWSKDYVVTKSQSAEKTNRITWPSSAGQEVVLKVSHLKRKESVVVQRNQEMEELSQTDMLQIYANTKSESRDTLAESSTDRLLQSKTPGDGDERLESHTSQTRSNPFAKSSGSTNATSPSLLSTTKRRTRLGNLIRFRRTVIDSDVVMQSKFFADPSERNEAGSDRALVDTVSSHGRALLADTSGRATRLELDECKENSTAEVGDDLVKNSIHSQLENGSLHICDTNKERIECESMDVSIEETKEEFDERIDVGSENTLREECIKYTSNEFISHQSENVPDNTDNSSRSSSRNSDLDYSVSGEDITFRYDLFEFANQKQSNSNESGISGQTNIAGIKSKMINSRKDRPVKRAQSVKKKVLSEQSRQCVLSMFGFQKKTALKH